MSETKCKPHVFVSSGRQNNKKKPICELLPMKNLSRSPFEIEFEIYLSAPRRRASDRR